MDRRIMYRVYYKLNVDFDFLKDSNFPFSHTETVDTNWLVKTESATNLSDEMRKFASDNNFNIHSYNGPDTFMFFRGTPNSDLEVHVDRGPKWGINYITGSQDHDMIWYGFTEGNDRSKGHEIPTSDGKASYLSFYPDQVVEVDRATLNGLYLVRIDMPHAVQNYDSNNYRYCLAVKDIYNKWSWEETVERFKPYLEI